MSYVPSGSWQSPGQPAPAPTTPGASVWWRVGHSWWLLLPIFGFSCLAGLGFLYIGLRARRPAWWLPGIVYLVFAWTAFVMVDRTADASVASDLTIGVFLLTWLVSIVHAAIINSSWLRWRAGHRPWYAPTPGAPVWPGTAYPTGYPGSPPTPMGYGPGSPVVAEPLPGPYQPIAGSPALSYPPTSGAPVVSYPPISGAPAASYPPISGSPAASYPYRPVDAIIPPPDDLYASPPLDPDLPPPVDPYSGPLPGPESPPPPRYYNN